MRPLVLLVCFVVMVMVVSVADAACRKPAVKAVFSASRTPAKIVVKFSRKAVKIAAIPFKYFKK